MSKFKNAYYFNQRKILCALQEVFDRIEGQYSNIPDCCIHDYIGLDGIKYQDLKDDLEVEARKDLLKKLKKFDYVPCRDCLEHKEPNELKLNGTSDIGKMILAIIDIVKNKEKENERKPTKRSKK